MAKINPSAAPPALSTHSKVRVADNRQRVPCLRRPTQSSLGKTKQANAVIATPNWQCLLCKLEQDVERAMAVMDQDSGKIMKYYQHIKHPKLSKAWTKSSSNKFGQLASGVGGEAQKSYVSSTNMKCPRKGTKTSPTAASFALYAPKKANPTKRASQLVAIESTILVGWHHQQLPC